jgi:Lon protease-like protein
MGAEVLPMSTELSLFPLNIVLFPGMVLPLHVFEERYKVMIQRCLASDTPFGVVLIQEGSEVGSPAVPHRVGTCARIINVERLPDGRLNLLTIGEERFHVTHYWEESEGYLRGNVTFFEDESATMPDQLLELDHRARRALVSYLSSLLAGVDLQDKDIPARDPLLLSFWTASLLNASNAVKQSLLEMTSTMERLELEIQLMEQHLKAKAFAPKEDTVIWRSRVLGERIFLN